MIGRRIATAAAVGMSLASLATPARAEVGGVWSASARYEHGLSDEAVDGGGTPFWYGVALRWDGGGKVSFFAELPVVRVENAGDVLLTGAGPVRGRSGAGHGAGNGPGPGGGAPGGGGATASAEPTTVETARDWTGVGDLRAGIAVPIFGSAASLQWLEALADVKAPTSPGDSPLSTGEWDGRVGVGWGHRFFAAELILDAGWNYIGNPEGYDLRSAPDAALTVAWESFRPALLWSAWITGRGEIAEGSGSGGSVGLEIGSAGATRWRTRASAGIGSGAGYDFSLAFVLAFGGGETDPSRWRTAR